MTASATSVPGDSVAPAARGFVAVLVILFLAAMVRFAWTGYLESDDSYYADAAHAWVAHFPSLGGSHWSLRYTIVLPMALLFRGFGENEYTLVAPTLLYGAALLWLTYASVRRVGGWGAGLLAVLLLGSMPVLAAGASIVADDVPEAFFVLTSLWAFWRATDGRRRPWQFVLSGVMAGCGFITRETTVALLIAYGILFLAGYGGWRRGFLWMGLASRWWLALTRYCCGLPAAIRSIGCTSVSKACTATIPRWRLRSRRRPDSAVSAASRRHVGCRRR